MIGYKALTKNMKSFHGDMQYELNKWYEIDGPIIPCKNGFHFCKDVENVMAYISSLKDIRVFKVETDGFVTQWNNICVAGKIRLTEEIPITEEIVQLWNKQVKIDTFPIIFYPLFIFFIASFFLLFIEDNISICVFTFSSTILALLNILGIIYFFRHYIPKKHYSKYINTKKEDN